MIQEAVRKYTGDISSSKAQAARQMGVVGWDIETSGLDWRKDKIATCQVFIPNLDIDLILVGEANQAPPNLLSLLADPKVMKVFHHAMFDLRFMAAKWGAEARNVVCTKIASKLLEPLEDDHSLKHVLQKHLQVKIDKRSRVSNWLTQSLSQEQLDYAASDVLYLPRLFSCLKNELERADRWHLAEKSFDYLPTRVQLDILGAGDVFSY
jgi:ribonuclease D